MKKGKWLTQGETIQFSSPSFGKREQNEMDGNEMNNFKIFFNFLDWEF